MTESRHYYDGDDDNDDEAEGGGVSIPRFISRIELGGNSVMTRLHYITLPFLFKLVLTVMTLSFPEARCLFTCVAAAPHVSTNTRVRQGTPLILFMQASRQAGWLEVRDKSKLADNQATKYHSFVFGVIFHHNSFCRLLPLVLYFFFVLYFYFVYSFISLFSSSKF